MVACVPASLDDRLGHALTVAAYLLRERRDSRASTAKRPSGLRWS
jgi:hypothetical protein